LQAGGCPSILYVQMEEEIFCFKMFKKVMKMLKYAVFQDPVLNF